jgi:hypothetical protein
VRRSMRWCSAAPIPGLAALACAPEGDAVGCKRVTGGVAPEHGDQQDAAVAAACSAASAAAGALPAPTARRIARLRQTAAASTGAGICVAAANAATCAATATAAAAGSGPSCVARRRAFQQVERRLGNVAADAARDLPNASWHRPAAPQFTPTLGVRLCRWAGAWAVGALCALRSAALVAPDTVVSSPSAEERVVP